MPWEKINLMTVYKKFTIETLKKLKTLFSRRNEKYRLHTKYIQTLKLLSNALIYQN